MLVRKRLVKKRLLLLMSSDSISQYGEKRHKRWLPRFWVRPHRNLKWWNDFINGNMLPEEWKENYRISQRSFYIYINVYITFYIYITTINLETNHTISQTNIFREITTLYLVFLVRWRKIEKNSKCIWHWEIYCFENLSKSYPRYFKNISHKIYTSTYYWGKRNSMAYLNVLEQ